MTDIQDAKGAGIHQRHIHAGDCQVGLFLHMLQQDATIVYFVDVVAGEHQDIFWPVASDQTPVLIHRIGRALVPVLADLLLRRQDVDEFVKASIQKAPAALQMLDQALRLVLRGDTDAVHARIDAIGECEINDAEFSAKRHASR